MKEFEERMEKYLNDAEEYGDNGIGYSMEGRMVHDIDRDMLHRLNIPLLRHLASRMDYEAIGQYICGEINKQRMDHD